MRVATRALVRAFFAAFGQSALSLAAESFDALTCTQLRLRVLSDDRHELLLICLLVARSLGDFFGKAEIASVLIYASSQRSDQACSASVVPYRRPATRLRQAAIAHLSLQRLGARNAAPQRPTDPEPKKLD